MKKTKIFFGIAALLVFFVGSQAIAKTEEEVMQQYDYSSPQASWNSLQLAIKNKDWEGILIHLWGFYKRQAASVPGFDFEGFIETKMGKYVEKRARKRWNDGHNNPNSLFYNKTYEETLLIVKRQQKEWQGEGHKSMEVCVWGDFLRGARNHPVVELRFIKELARKKLDNGVESCRIEVVDSLGGWGGYVDTYSLDGLHWWINLQPCD